MSKVKNILILLSFLFLAFFTSFILNKKYEIATTIELKNQSKNEYILSYEINGNTEYKKIVPDYNIISVGVPLDANKINLTTINNKKIQKNEIESIYLDYTKIDDFDDFQNIANNLKKDLRFKFTVLPISFILLSLLISYLAYKYLYIRREKTFKFFIDNHIIISKIIIGLFFTCFILIMFPYKYPAFGILSSDYSWQYALNHFFNNPSFIPGRDYAFTYGPLTFIIAPLKMGNNLLIATIINLIVVIISWGYLLYLYLSKSVSSDKFAVFSVLFFMFVPFYNETLWIFITLILAFSILKFCTENTKLALTSMILLSGISALTLFIKMNLGIELLCVSGLCCLILLFDLKIKSLKYLFAFFIPYILFLVIGIKFLFYNIDNFVNWFILSLDVAKGYSHALLLIGDYNRLILAILIFVVLLYILYRSFKTDRLTFKNSLILLIVFYFSFKHGFIVQEIIHEMLFFIAMFYGFALLLLFVEKFKKEHLVIFLVIFCICMTPVKKYINYIPYNIDHIPYANYNYKFIKTFLNYNKLNNITYSNIESYMSYFCPKVDLQDNQKFEFIPWNIACAKYYKTGNLKVNPILQFYSIYTSKLDGYSAQQYMNNAADALIVQVTTLSHNRNLYLDTPKTWNTILSNYELKESNKKYLLLNKKLSPDKYDLKLLNSATYKLNEPIAIPETDKILYAKIYLNPTFLEKIKRILFRGSFIMMDIKSQNSDVKYRVIETMFNTPVIINYIPQNGGTDDWINLFDNNFDESKKVSEIQFIANKLFYSESFKIEWYIKVPEKNN